MIKRFRKEILKGIHTFKYQGRLYQVLDDYIIYHAESDTVYYRDTDF